MAGTRRGVLQPEVVKSIRIKRAESEVNCSRQNGHTGASRGGVFSTIVSQQFAQRTWPVENISKIGKKKENTRNYAPHGIECGSL